MALETTFIEEALEDFILDQIRAADLGFRQLSSLDGWEINADNLRKFLGARPCCLVGIGDITYRDETGNGKVQLTSPAELLVYIADENAHRRRTAVSRVRQLRRQVRQIIRGIVIETTAGAAAQRSIIRLREDSIVLATEGLIMYEQVYHISALDSNAEES